MITAGITFQEAVSAARLQVNCKTSLRLQQDFVVFVHAPDTFVLRGLLLSEHIEQTRPRFCRQRVYSLTILGNTMHTALLGMFAYWGPKGATLMFRMLAGQADLVFGVVTVLTGILGTLAGGAVLDKLGGDAHAAGKVCFVCISAGFGLLQLGFLFTTSFDAFVVVFAAGQFALFMLQVRTAKFLLHSVNSH